jgi:streptogramin lyase
MIQSKIGIAWIIALPLLGGPSALLGCSGNGGAVESTGTVGMQVTLPDGSHIGTVSYTISGGPTSKSGTFDVSKSNTVSAIIGGLAAGSGYMISLSATSSAGYPCAGTAGPFTVKANATIPATVVLTCHAPRRNGSISINGVVDVCPGIDSIDAAPSSAAVGNDIGLTASASPDQTAQGFPLVYTWTGVTSATGGAATLHCSSAGSFPVTVSVSNGDSACITNPPDPAMSATVTVTCDVASGGDAGALPDSGGSDATAPLDTGTPTSDGSVPDSSADAAVGDATTDAPVGDAGSGGSPGDASASADARPSGSMVEFNLPSGVTPRAITAGPDGNLWLVDFQNHVDRMTTSGVVTQFALPTSAAGAEDRGNCQQDRSDYTNRGDHRIRNPPRMLRREYYSPGHSGRTG